MKTTDLRDATFQSLRRNLAADRRAVYEAWVIYGPATTRDLAERSGIDVLNVRPRTTELLQLGLLKLVGLQSRQGIYLAVDEDLWIQWQKDHVFGQMILI